MSGLRVQKEGPQSQHRGDCGGWGVESAWQNPNLIHHLIPKKGLGSGVFYSRRTGVKDDSGWGPGPCRPRGDAVLSCPSQSPPPHRPTPLCLPLSISISPDHGGQAQNRPVVSRLLTSLSQSSAQMPRAWRVGVGSALDLQESCQWEEESHTDSVLNLLDPTTATTRTATQGPGVAWGCPLGGQGGPAQRLRSKQVCHGRAEWKERPGLRICCPPASPQGLCCDGGDLAGPRPGFGAAPSFRLLRGRAGLGAHQLPCLTPGGPRPKSMVGAAAP